MSTPALDFSDVQPLGRVASVDTGNVWIDAEQPELVTQIAVGSLVAIRGATQSEFLIGITERITRSLRDELQEPEYDENELEITAQPSDLIRVVLVGTFREIDGDQRDTFKRGADSFPQVDRECFSVSGENLQRFMVLLGAGVAETERLELGQFIADRTALAVADGNRFFQRHASILGSTGSGKSWCVALLLERASSLRNTNIIVLDMHGEYEPLTKAEDKIAAGLRIAGPGDLSSPADDCLFLPYWLLNREELLSMLLDRSDQNAPNQAARFTGHVRELKDQKLESEGMLATRKTFTVDSPIPYSLTDLLGRLKDDDTRKGVGAKGQAVKGPWEGKLTRFIARLETKIEDRRYGFMFQPPTEALKYSWLADQMKKLLAPDEGGKGIKVVDFSEVPSDVLPVVAGTLARLLYDVQFWMEPLKRIPFALLCDEAHLYLPTKDDATAVEKAALDVFERIAKEGRKYGVGLVVVSQRPADVSRTILSQCNNFIVLRLTNDRDQGVVRRLVPDSMSRITDILPLLDTGEGLLLGDAILLPSRIRLAEPKLQPASATRPFWTDWRESTAEPEAIEEAVEVLRRQTRVEA